MALKTDCFPERERETERKRDREREIGGKEAGRLMGRCLNRECA